MEISIALSGMSNGTTGLGNFCQSYFTSPIDTTETIAARGRVCSLGAIEIDSVVAGDGEVSIFGIWRLA